MLSQRAVCYFVLILGMLFVFPPFEARACSCKQKKQVVDTVILGKGAVENARTEIIWVVDRTFQREIDEILFHNFIQDIQVYYEDLDRNEVSWSSVYLASDGDALKGIPATFSNELPLLQSAEGDDYSELIEAMMRVTPAQGATSSVWSLDKFLGAAPTISNLYHKGFFTENTPVEIFLLSLNRDSYKQHSANTSKANWSVDRFLENWKQFFRNEKQSVRVSLVAPTALFDSSNPSAESALYKNLVTKTGGALYLGESEEFDMTLVFEDFSKASSFRAKIHGMNKIMLSKTPRNPNQIEVRIRGKKINGNSSSPSSLWSYDKASNAVVPHWFRFDLSTIKEGDKVEIRYQE